MKDSYIVIRKAIDMKRKPILMNNIRGNLTNKKRIVIGIIGTHRGVGVTHFGIMFAQYINEILNAKTALLECNNHNDLRHIQNAYMGVEKEQEFSREFSIYGVTYFRNVSENEVAEILNRDFEYYILDLGIEFEQNKKEFLRSDLKFVIGSLAEWRIDNLFNFHKKTSRFHGSDTFSYLIVFGIKKEIKELKKELDMNVIEIPYEPDPFLLSKNSLKYFHKLK